MRIKRTLSFVLIIYMVFTLCCYSVDAITPIDLNAECTVNVIYHYEKTSIAGANFDFYYVANAENYPSFFPLSPYDSYPVSYAAMKSPDWDELAVTLKGYALRDDLTPAASGVTDENGELTVGSLKTGLYLVVADICELDDVVYTSEPFFVILPGHAVKSDEWKNNVTVYPKVEASSNPKEKKIERRVLKIWDDGQSTTRPQNIIVDLLRDGEVFDTVVLNEDNNWHYEWNGLNRESDWIVVEREVRGYTAKTVLKGSTYTIYNKSDNAPPLNPPDNPPTLPQTGLLWWPVPMLLAVGLLCILIGILRRRGVSDE